MRQKSLDLILMASRRAIMTLWVSDQEKYVPLDKDLEFFPSELTWSVPFRNHIARTFCSGFWALIQHCVPDRRWSQAFVTDSVLVTQSWWNLGISRVHGTRRLGFQVVEVWGGESLRSRIYWRVWIAELLRLTSHWKVCKDDCRERSKPRRTYSTVLPGPLYTGLHHAPCIHLDGLQTMN